MGVVPTTRAGGARSIRVGLLGATEVIVDGRGIEIPGELTRLLFVALALHPRRPVTADRCIDELWGDDLPKDPRNALQARVSELRRLLDPGLIVSSRGTYALDVAPERVDAVALELLVERVARQLAMGDLARARHDADQARQLVRGAPLLDVAGSDWIEGERRRLTETVATAEELWLETRLAAGEYELVVDDAVAAVAADSTRERRWAMLMRALYGAGRPVDALRAFQDARRSLGEELGVDPGPELVELERMILEHDSGLATQQTTTSLPSSERMTRRHQGRLPTPRTGLIGRDDDVEVVFDLASSRQLVTLTGPGGAGKTRLAIAVAQRLVERRDGSTVRFVDLAAISNPADVTSAFAEAVGLLDLTALPEVLLDRVLAHLESHPYLLVVDNCEHVIDEAAHVVDAVLSVHGVRILATSREPLGVSGEHQWPVPTLRVPSGTDDDARSAPAVALFVKRAQQVDPDLVIDGPAIELVAQLVRALGGLPLAIELAASRVRAIGLDGLVSRLDGMLDLLTDGQRTAQPRQRTLRALIDWSYGLLFEDEQVVFRRLGVLAGPFDIDLAEALCADERLRPSEVTVLVGRLVDKSMVARDSGGRHRLLDPLRHFALEQLDRAGELAQMRDRHLDVFLERITTHDEVLRADQLVAALDRVERDQPEYRTALRWVGSHPDERHARLIARLGWFWFLRDHGHAARSELSALIDGGRVPDDVVIWYLDAWFALDEWSVERARAAAERAVQSAHPYVEGRAHAVQALATLAVGTRLLATPRPVEDVQAALQMAELARERSAGSGDAWGLGVAALVHATAQLCGGDFAAALERAALAVELFDELDDLWGRSKARYLRGIAELNLGRTGTAYETNIEAIALAERLGHADTIAALMQQLAVVHLVRGELAEARPLIDDAVEIGRRLGALPSIAYPLNLAGLVERRSGHPDSATAHHTEALDLYLRTPLPLGPVFSRLCLAFAHAEAGRLDDARHHLREVWQAPELREPRTRAMALEALAATCLDEPERVARLLGAADALRARPAFVPAAPLPDRSDLELLTGRVRNRLDSAAFEAEFERGRASADRLDDRP